MEPANHSDGVWPSPFPRSNTSSSPASTQGHGERSIGRGRQPRWDIEKRSNFASFHYFLVLVRAIKILDTSPFINKSFCPTGRSLTTLSLLEKCPHMISSLNPPFPPLAKVETDDHSSSLSNQKDPAHRLLRLVRLVEKEPPGDTYESYMEETVGLMNSLILVYSRRGLLQGNTWKAEKILSSTSQGQTGSHGRKKGSTNKKSTNDSLPLGGASETATSDSAQLSESLVFTALTRIIAESEESREGRPDDSSLLLALGAELCLSIVRHVQVNKDLDHPCAVAEYEILALSAKSMLSGFVSRIQSLENEIRRHSSQHGGASVKSLQKCLAMTVFLDETRHVAPVLSSLRAACALVMLFGTKLSRSTALLVDLHKVAWTFIAAPNADLQDAAGRLLAALPLVGGSDRKTPIEMWNSGFQDILHMMNTLVESVVPVGNKPSTYESVSLSGESARVLQDWTSFLGQDITTGRDRASTFVIIMRGLVLAYQHYLSPDLNGDAAVAFLDIKLDLESILVIVERFASYPMAAETLFFRTKNRLRDEVVEGGLISPRLIATQVANEIKLLGHQILDFLIQSVGGPTLLPYARRIIRVAYASLLTSCSGHVRKVMDPSSTGQLEGKKRRWLHLSVTLRTRAVETTQTVIVAFGSDRTAKTDSSERKAESKSDGEMAITLVAGCLMEMIGAKDVEESLEENWGTLDERVALMNTVSSSFDPFWRSSVQSRIFRLAGTCLSTPWNDGAASSVVRSLKNSALKVLHDGDESISLAAMEALRICDLFGTPRAPPLVFVRRTLSEHSERFEGLAPKAIADIQKCQVDTKLARAAAEDAEKTLRHEKRLRETEKEEYSKRKRVIAQETKEEPIVIVDTTSKAENPQYAPVEEAGSVEAREEVGYDDPGHADGSAEVEDGNSEASQSQDEDFPDIDITAYGPDSEDD